MCGVGDRLRLLALAMCLVMRLPPLPAGVGGVLDPEPTLPSQLPAGVWGGVGRPGVTWMSVSGDFVLSARVRRLEQEFASFSYFY